jgi:histone-lysine N-methyltransferase SETD8
VLPDAGRGVFSKIKFREGDIVCEYEGELIGKKELERRQKMYNKNPEKYGSYVFEFCAGNKIMAIDATTAYRTFGRLINHSAKYMNVKPVKFRMRTGWGIQFVALRDIVDGEQLLYEYGEKRHDIVEANPWLKS